MPLLLSDSLVFPDPREADTEGLLAIGGDLSTERLILAYSNGIFPWYEEDYPILWWSPDPRMVLFPDEIRISHSLKQRLRNSGYEIRFDTAFEEVIRNCALANGRQEEGTWITSGMIKAYITLHNLNLAHSVETWKEGQLVGGLYGVSLGKAFFGESMFHKMTDASKVALVYLALLMVKLKFIMIDVQQETEHLKRMGARTIPRDKFLKLLQEAMKYKTLQEKWTKFGLQF